MTKRYSMDRAVKKLNELHAVTAWLLRHWRDFPKNVYRGAKGFYIPDDPRLMILQILHEDAANQLTIARHWRDMAEADGVDLDSCDEDNHDDD